MDGRHVAALPSPADNSAFCTLHLALFTRRSFTLTEMLVVLGIIALVAAMSLPLLVPLMRARTLDSALDTIKSACNLARSTAIEQRKPINLTFLQQTDATHGPGLVITAYEFAGEVTTTGSDVISDANQNWTVDAFQNYDVLLFPTNYPGWNSSTTYGVGSFVLDRGTVYICIAPNPNSGPPNTSYWQPIPTPQVRRTLSNTSNTITVTPYPWSASHTYNPGDMVSDKGTNYLCIAQALPPTLTNNTEPPNVTYWQAPSSLWDTQPATGDVYVVMAPAALAQPYCIHYLGNYSYNYYQNSSTPAPADVRFTALKTFSQYMGETIQYLPTGCQFTFEPPWNPSESYGVGSLVSDKGVDYVCVATNSNSEPPNPNYWQTIASQPPGTYPQYAQAWTYVFLPDGEVWTLTPQAQDVRDSNWFLTTYTAPPPASPWSASASYAPGNLVSDKGLTYICVTANSNSEPPSANWRAVSNSQPSGPTVWGPQNLTWATIIVYATTGEAVSQ
jgi:prepilin-type N-terminal cleavage/methylation domain-containing protein